MKYINYVGIRDGKFVERGREPFIVDALRPTMRRILSEVKKYGDINLNIRTVFCCSMNEKYKIYRTLLADEEFHMFCPLIETVGAFDEQGAKIVWDEIVDEYKKKYKIELPADHPQTPFVCEITHPDMEEVPSWNNEFIASFAEVILNSFNHSDTDDLEDSLSFFNSYRKDMDIDD